MLEVRCKVRAPLQVDAFEQVLHSHQFQLRRLGNDSFSIKDDFGQMALPRLQALVHQFDPSADAVTSLHWFYDDPKGIKQGPYPAAQLCRWARRPDFAQNIIWLELASTGLLLPLAFVTSTLLETDAARTDTSCPGNQLDVEMDCSSELDSFRRSQAGHGAISTPNPPSLQLPQPMQIAIDGRRQVVIVCDTNILVSAKMHLLMRLMASWTQADGYISLDVTALVPYIVLKELDGLKAGRRQSDPGANTGEALALQHAARQAIASLSNNPQMRGQSFQDHCKGSGSCTNADDHVLECAWQQQSRAQQLSGGLAASLLLTEDLNLRNAASASHVRAAACAQLPRHPLDFWELCTSGASTSDRLTMPAVQQGGSESWQHLGSCESSWADLGSALRTLIQTGMGPAVLHRYQQDVGEHWQTLLEDPSIPLSSEVILNLLDKGWWTFGKDLFDCHHGLDANCKELARFFRLQAAAGQRHEVLRAAKSVAEVIGHLQPLSVHRSGTSFAGSTYTAAEANTALCQGQAAAKFLLAICKEKDAQEGVLSVASSSAPEHSWDSTGNTAAWQISEPFQNLIATGFSPATETTVTRSSSEPVSAAARHALRRNMRSNLPQSDPDSVADDEHDLMKCD
ncbi:hypothetical protein WJX74_008100 [Apatococcus lobatus]|uniref:GYF domain-containing protein n=1 Tax=Apatococcus lobatus TaxID=904363 RepID=A0AAW1S3E3_9CHLO